MTKIAIHALFDHVTWPESITMPDGTIVPTMKLARGVADDVSPGCDEFPPFWLRDTARLMVKPERVRKEIASAGAKRTSRPEVVEAILGGDDGADEDSILILSTHAVDDVLGEDVGGRASSRLNRLDVDDGALILLLAALPYEHEHPNAFRPNREAIDLYLEGDHEGYEPLAHAS